MKSESKKVFLSSTFGERGGANALRAAFLDAADDNVWYYESQYDPEEQISGPEAIRRCLPGVRECDVFALLLTRRRGSPVRFGDSQTQVSVFEAEILAAAALGKRIYVFREDEFALEDDLETLLQVLAVAAAAQCWIKGTPAELLGAWRRLLQGGAGPAPMRLGPLLDSFGSLRSRPKRSEEVSKPLLGFVRLGDFHDQAGDIDAAVEAINIVREGRAEVDGVELTHLDKMSFLWVALRELDGADARDVDLAPLRNEALGRWSASASWLGLHGHLLLSPLAASNARLDLWERFTGLGADREGRHPDHARASALYSIASHAANTRVRRYREVQAILNRLEVADSRAFEMSRTVRGKARLRLAMLGRLDLLSGAGTDFSRAVKFRERHEPHDPFSLGDALTELGLFQAVITGKLGGASTIGEGIDLMSSVGRPSAEQAGFLARAYRTLATALPPWKSIAKQDALERSRSYAEQSESLDQLRIIS